MGDEMGTTDLVAERERLVALLREAMPYVCVVSKSNRRRGVDTIEAFPQWPLTTAGLAADAGINVRVLQQCWRRHRDVTPMSYLRGVRLACAHRDLEEHAPGETTVSATAFNWGLARPARSGRTR